MHEKVRVLVVEDEARMRTSLVDMLEEAGYAAEAASDGPSGEAAARSGGYGLVILDLLPREEGLELCRKLRGSRPATPIVMLGDGAASADVVAALGEGADDYVAKPFDASVLIARAQAILRRAGPSGGTRGNGVLSFGEFRLDRNRGELTRGNEQVPLNAQEYRLLDYLAANPNRVIGRKEMLDLVWGYESDTATRTIDVHIAKLRQHLGESALPRHIVTVRGQGYKFVGPSAGEEPSGPAAE